MHKRSFVVKSLIQYKKFLYRYHSIANKFFAITTVDVNNMETRLNKSEILKVKIIPKTYSLLLTTFEIKWLVVDGSVEDLAVSR